MFKICLSLLLTYVCSVEATLKSPWFGNDKEFIAELYLSSTSQKIDYLTAPVKQTNLVQQGMSLTLSPYEYLNTQIEFITSRSAYRSTSFESFCISSQYQITNDLNYDAYASSVNLALKIANGQAITDPTVFIHSRFEGILSYSFGKEFSYLERWNQRFYLTPAIHFPFTGPLYYSIGSYFDFRLNYNWIFSISLKGQISTGRKFNKESDFISRYSEHQYHFLDAYMYLHHEYERCGRLSFFIGSRIKRRYCPKKTYSLGLRYKLPFGI